MREEKENKRKIKKEDTMMLEEIGEEGFGLTSEIANKAFTMKGWILPVLKRTL